MSQAGMDNVGPGDEERNPLSYRAGSNNALFDGEREAIIRDFSQAGAS